MQLTPHFSDAELTVVGCEPRIIANATQLAQVLLEPIRQQFGPLAISDGYRSPQHNAAVGGVCGHSQHLYLDQNSAADFRPLNADITEVFAWIRLDSHLPFDQCILECAPGTQTPRCIHISHNGALSQQRRQGLTGYTNGAGRYTRVAVEP